MTNFVIICVSSLFVTEYLICLTKKRCFNIYRNVLLQLFVVIYASKLMTNVLVYNSMYMMQRFFFTLNLFSFQTTDVMSRAIVVSSHIIVACKMAQRKIIGTWFAAIVVNDFSYSNNGHLQIVAVAESRSNNRFWFCIIYTSSYFLNCHQMHVVNKLHM